MIQLIVTIIFLSLASITDIKFNRVKNNHVLLFMIIGFIGNILFSGVDGIIITIFGLLVPLIIGYPLFLLGFIPAGDVKLFMALGAINGIQDTGSLLMVTLLLGGLYSMILLTKSNNFSGFVNFYHYLKETIVLKKLSTYNSEKSIRFPLAPVTFISYLLFIFLFDML